ncbi:signal transduction histidine kinase [Paucibacter oligotrophus]|uniref:Signal transduction histidine kinase n=1 Tax=Roseateles oligotrophus TaxID=1769250 RepID=A0A840L7Z4_9BURK|nr:histidine kinase [Roseateles oligotrophus]MBB4842785.1 signal transduction histidine kinase [Roseateles oligotrophus]
MQDTPNPRFDWALLFYPGPKRRFTPEEMQRGGQQPWPKVIDAYVALNIVLLLIPALTTLRALSWRALLVVLIFGGLLGYIGLAIARHLWRRPTRKQLNIISVAYAFAVTLPLALDKYWLPAGVTHKDLAFPLVSLLTLFIMSISAWWFLVIYRVQQIEARLRELDEQDRNLKLARRLATAQIQPHFLFNTLASVQHWVDTQDTRAGSTLRSFTAYLRATLPMFERETLSLNEELGIVRSYLEVMQARMGARLRWSTEICEGVAELPLPPGLLLTLVENAIGHGIEPALRGGSIAIRVSRPNEAQVLLEVSDDGVGLTQGSETATNGLGLKNSDERLRQLYGGRARLTLLPQQPGCLARLEIDWMQESK